MVASSHPPLTDVMTERPCELLHVDLVGPARVLSTGGKWYILVVVDDNSRYVWVFFLEEKGETVVWTSLGPLPRWVPGPTTRWPLGLLDLGCTTPVGV
jgi:hypothetical protein